MTIKSVVASGANSDVGVELFVWYRAHVVSTCVAKHTSTCPGEREEGERMRGEDMKSDD